ncbi:hypothetical protein GCM10027615_64790 [Plantactinospora veratri]
MVHRDRHGADSGEILALRWEDLDLAAERPTLTICGTLVFVKGKGFFRQPWTKSDAGYRMVVLPRFAVGMLLFPQTSRCRQSSRRDLRLPTRHMALPQQRPSSVAPSPFKPPTSPRSSNPSEPTSMASPKL